MSERKTKKIESVVLGATQLCAAVLVDINVNEQ